MANKEHLKVVKAGAEAIAEWRLRNPKKRFDLSGANLRRTKLEHSDLTESDFRESNASWADFRWADLTGSNFTGAILTRADFHKADLQRCDFSGCDLTYTNFEDSNLNDASFHSAVFGRTRLFNINLSFSRGLDSCKHSEVSFVDQETLSTLDSLPETFLKGIGVLSGFKATVIKVAVGSPSDVAQERERARVSIYEWNDSNTATKKVVLLPVLWEYHSTPEIGDHPQRLLDKRLLKGSQILVAIFWSRLGSPTPDAVSGTVGEIEKFIADGKQVLVYFCTKSIPPENIDAEHWEKLMAFKKSIQNRGLIGNFESLSELDRKLKQHLSDTIDRLGQ